MIGACRMRWSTFIAILRVPGCAVLTLAIVTAMPTIAAAQSVSTIVYSRLHGESTEIWRIDADGSNHKRKRLPTLTRLARIRRHRSG